tara:strand:+ start:11650 stop:13194 length:1545 start_codon:yes stop_codon:yes gene_type:complete
MAKKSNLFGRADASLVNAAFREGMTRGPGDLSKVYQEQLNTNNMMWQTIQKGFDQAFGKTIALNEKFEETTDKVMSNIITGDTYDDAMTSMYNDEIIRIKNAIKAEETGSLEEKKLYAELERLKSSTDAYGQTMIKIGKFVEDRQHNPHAMGDENLKTLTSIMDGTAKHRIVNGKLEVSATGEEGTYLGFEEVNDLLAPKNHGNQSDLVKRAGDQFKFFKENRKAKYDERARSANVNYIYNNNFKTKKDWADLATTRIAEMPYSLVEAIHGKDPAMKATIDMALDKIQSTDPKLVKAFDVSGPQGKSDGKITSADFNNEKNKQMLIKALTDVTDKNFNLDLAKRIGAEFYERHLMNPYATDGVENRAVKTNNNRGKSQNIGVSYGNKYISRSAADAFFRDMTNKQKKIFSPNGKTYEFINGQYYITNLVNPETQDLLPPQPRSNMQILSAAELWNEGYRIDEFKGKTSDEDANNVLNNAYQKQQSSQVQGIYSDVYTDPNAVVNLFPNLNLEDQ